jgi:beta-galactosidase GanA
MNCRSFAAFVASLNLLSPAEALDFWHSGTVWAGQGQCSATFLFDSGLEEIRSLQISVDVVDKSGKSIESAVLSVKDFGSSSSTRYAEDAIESERICADGLMIVVTKASAIVNGKRTDLIKTKGISTRDFKPFKIRIGK